MSTAHGNDAVITRFRAGDAAVPIVVVQPKSIDVSNAKVYRPVKSDWACLSRADRKHTRRLVVYVDVDVAEEIARRAQLEGR